MGDDLKTPLKSPLSKGGRAFGDLAADNPPAWRPPLLRAPLLISDYFP